MSRFGTLIVTVLSVAAVITVSIAVISPKESNDQSTAESSAGRLTTTATPPSQGKGFESKSATSAANGASDAAFDFDKDRLYDPSYETDPALVEFAAEHGISPKCLIARVKAYFDRVPADQACANESAKYDYSAHRLNIRTETYVCEDVSGVPHCQTVRVREHPYDEYSDAELRYLADSSAEASFLLAKRLGWDDEAEFFFEQAVALSGKSGPLEHFLVMKDASGISRSNGKLQAPQAMTTYEVSLVMGWLGWPDDARLRYVEGALLEEGYDLEPVRQRAVERYNRITQRRLELLGRNWDGE